MTAPVAPVLLDDRTVSWESEGACRGTDPDVMYPHPKDDRGNALAKAWCRGCPVVEVCLQQSLAREEPYGVWGGLGERERRQVLRRRAAEHL